MVKYINKYTKPVFSLLFAHHTTPFAFVLQYKEPCSRVDLTPKEIFNDSKSVWPRSSFYHHVWCWADVQNGEKLLMRMKAPYGSELSLAQFNYRLCTTQAFRQVYRGAESRQMCVWVLSISSPAPCCGRQSRIQQGTTQWVNISPGIPPCVSACRCLWSNENKVGLLAEASCRRPNRFRALPLRRCQRAFHSVLLNCCLTFFLLSSFFRFLGSPLIKLLPIVLLLLLLLSLS